MNDQHRNEWLKNNPDKSVQDYFETFSPIIIRLQPDTPQQTPPTSTTTPTTTDWLGWGEFLLPILAAITLVLVMGGTYVAHLFYAMFGLIILTLFINGEPQMDQPSFLEEIFGSRLTSFMTFFCLTCLLASGIRQCVVPANIRMIVFNGYDQDIEVVVNGRTKHIKKGDYRKILTHHAEQSFVFPDRSFTTALGKGTHLISFGDATALTVKELIYDRSPYLRQYGFHINTSVQNRIYTLPAGKVRVFFPGEGLPNTVYEKVGDDRRYFQLGVNEEL